VSAIDISFHYKVISSSGVEVFSRNLSDLGMGNGVDLYEIKAIGLSGGRSLVSWLGYAGTCGGPYQFVILDESGNKVAENPATINTENGSYLCVTAGI
jgi:hypothetical protein